MSNKITTRNYLILILIFSFMFMLTVINIFMSNTLMFLSAFITIISVALLILLEPKRSIKIKYGQKTLLHIN